MPSSAVVGCQSMGAMRSSKSEDGLNFHLRITVQPMATAATQDAITMITVRAVFGTDAEAPLTTGTDVSVGAADPVTVWNTKLAECLEVLLEHGTWDVMMYVTKANPNDE